MKVLVTDGDQKQTLAIVRHLGLSGYKSHVLCFTPRSLCSHSKFSAGELVVPAYSDRSFAPEFLDLLERERFDLVIPVGSSAMRALVPLKAKFPKTTQMITVDEQVLSLCLSKEDTYRFAESVGVPVPKTWYPTLEGLLDLLDTVTYPIVIKGRFETGFSIVDYAYNKAEALQKYGQIIATYQLDENSLPLLQQYIEGDGHGFFAVYQNGRCGKTFQHHRLREFPPSGGFSVAAESSYNEEVYRYGKTLLDALRWNGVAMVEFKVTAQGQPYLMEVNPKFWGSVDLSLAAGVNFPLELVRMAQGETLKPERQYRFPFRYHWPLHGDFLHAIMEPKSALKVLLDSLNPSVESNLWWRKDFSGTIGIVINLMGKAIRRCKKMIGL